MTPTRIAITFGVRYDREQHPADPRITGHTYVVFCAPTWEQARAAAIARLGLAWSFDYALDEEFLAIAERHGWVDLVLDDVAVTP